jgi:hypothetical protein
MTTALDLITLSLKEAGVIGIGQTAQGDDIVDAMRILNGMLAQWRTKRCFVYHLVDLTVSTTGAASYSVGPGGDIDVATRPNVISGAFLRMPASQVDYPLTMLRAYEDYARVSAKNISSLPSHVFYDTGYPLGTIHAWPIPPAGYELHLLAREELPSFALPSDTVELPGEYEEAIRYGLAVRLRPLYQLEPDPTLVALATSAFNTLRAANAQIPLMSMPANLVAGGRRYNIYSDRIG